MAVQLLRTSRRSLDISTPDSLQCREQECLQILSFLKGHLCDETGGSLYICGAPGTGKSACLSTIFKKLDNTEWTTVYLNCMELNLKSSTSLLTKLLKVFKLGAFTSETAARKRLQRYFATRKQMLLLALDEVDQLKQTDLYPLFEWPSLPSSKLVLLTIANALDFTESALPRLRTLGTVQVELLHFTPYTSDQLTQIVNSRLQENTLTLFDRTAIEFCARKVSSFSGDARKMLSICSAALEKREAQLTSKRILQSSSVVNQGQSASDSVRKVTLTDIDAVIKAVYGTKVEKIGSSSRDSKENRPTLPLQQKLVICSLFGLVKGKRCKDTNLSTLYSRYSKVCDKQNISAVDRCEVLGICELLESNTLVGVKKDKTGKVNIRLRIDEKELSDVIANSELLGLAARVK